jgi:hypothetical protein
MHKYVVSTTRSKAPWKESTIISGNVVEEITKLNSSRAETLLSMVVGRWSNR